MRKITKNAYNAFINKKRFNSGNTDIYLDFDENPHMRLFDNVIAKMDDCDDIWISDGDYGTSKTTEERLSAFINIRISKGTFIIDEKFEWDGCWFNVSEYKRNH